MMIGDQAGHYNRYSKGALDAEMGVVDIDLNDNILRNSMGELLSMSDDAAEQLALNYAGGKLTEAGLGMTAAGICKAKSALGAAKAAGRRAGGAWRKLPGGVRIKQVGKYWIKEVNPDASALARWWGRVSLNAQARGLGKLGNMAPSNLFMNGRPIMRDTGPYTPGRFWSTWWEGSTRLGTIFNDIRPRDIGGGGLIFDPGLHPIQQGLEAGAVGLGIGFGGLYLYNQQSE